jgi:hypothetical protein
MQHHKKEMDPPRFELGTSCLQGRRSTGLSYKPIARAVHPFCMSMIKKNDT